MTDGDPTAGWPPDDIRQWAGPLPPPDAAGLADRYAVSQLVRVYALGIDMRDRDLMLSAFDRDGIGRGTVGTLPLGEYLTRTYRAAIAFHVTQHTVLNQYVTIDGDAATMWSYAVAYHIRGKGDADGNLTVGVQYRDRCRRTAGGWLIARRQAVMQWVDGVMPVIAP